MKSLTILLALFVLIGCQNGKKNNNPDERLQEKEVPDNFDIGEAKDGRYTNNYFNLSFEYDQEWDVLTYEELESLMDMGVEVSSQSNKKLKKSFEAAKVRTAQHFGAFKHDPETFTGMFNPSVLVLSENVTMHDMQYGDEYLEKIRDTWSKTNMGIKQDGAIEEEKIDGRTFFTLKGRANTYGVEVLQKYHCTIVKGFALVVIETYLDEGQSKETQMVMESMEFKKA